MINRILIRIKVVQMLYSYLLTRSDFKVITEPRSATADNKFAFAVYNDLLLVLLELTGHGTRPGARKGMLDVDKKLLKSAVGAALAGDDTIKALIANESTDITQLRPSLQHLHDMITASAVYADYRKRRSPSLAEEVSMWLTVLETIVMRDTQFMETLRSVDGFTNVGLEAGIEMLIDTLNSYRDATDGYATACNDLERSLSRAYDLYVACFTLIIELTREQERRIEQAKTKYTATPDELNPNLKFVNNRLVTALENNEQIQEFLSKNPVNWATELSLVNSLLKAITDSQIYRDYMSSDDNDYEHDCDFWRDILRTVVFTSDDFLEVLEDKSVFWNDDLQIIGTFVLKTIRQSSKAYTVSKEDDTTVEPVPEVILLDKFKDEEDARFGGELFVKAVKHRKEYRALIDRFVNNDSWDPERIAFMDIIIMITAITEVVEFPNIPLPVTMNEYVEIANDYSSPKSGQFVNGILFNIVTALKAEGKVFK